MDRTYLKQSEGFTEGDLLRTLLNSSPDAIYFKDLQSRFLFVSLALATRFNVQSIDELMGKTDREFFAGDHAEQAFADEQEIIRTGVPIIGRVERETYPDGRVTWALSSKMPLRNGAGDIIGTFGISKDITRLKEAEATLEKTHRDLLDLSRKAGMAEIATSVLHNVGNVLNSVVVSAALIGARLHNSKTKGLASAVHLMEEHRTNLGNFLTEDESGRRLPGYLNKLVAALNAERDFVLQEFDSLNKGVNHIRDIITTQQSYAKGKACIVEPVRIGSLLEDALRMNGTALTRLGVIVVKLWPEMPEVLLDKHLVLQILVNFINNALQAMEAVRERTHRLTLKAGKNDTPSGGVILIDVEDTGEGISPDSLARLFAHGFTTRKKGHGFGLHSCALAAKAMGGIIRAHSDGVGRGARFTLELPLKEVPAIDSNRRM